MNKFIQNIETTIAEGETNPLNVMWDMEIESYDTDEEARYVGKIRKVEVLIFDKYGIPITDHFTGMGASRLQKDRLEKMLLAETESMTYQELRREALV